MTWRYRAVLVFLLLFFSAILLRLFYWQIVKAEDLSVLGLEQYERSTQISPQRGEIRTSDNFAIAANKLTYLLYANPKEIDNIKSTSAILSSTLQMEEASVSSQLSLDRFWVPIKKGLNFQEKEEIEKLRIEGLGFEKTYERLYPEASMAAHILGIVGKDESGIDKGYFGLEGYYDRLLRGKGGDKIEIYDALGRPIIQEVSDTLAISGDSLVLNIDRTIQFIVEAKLKRAVERYGAEGGMVAVLNPKTGKVLSLSSYPFFSPKNYEEYSEDFFKNPTVSNLYEPGSTFKPLIMSAALEEGLVNPQTKCNICDKPVSLGGYEIHTWNDKYFKDITMTEVIEKSDNTGMVFVGQKLGIDKMLNYLDRFGIGKITGIDLQGEVNQPLPPKETWYEVDIATRAFGQGISITAMQLISAFSSIANKGIRMEPQVVDYVVTSDGEKKEIDPKTLGRPISEKTSKIMTEMLVNAVNNGEASWVKLDGYRIAGKTGTASIPVKGKYDPNKTVASFIGFAPADEPKFVMLVVLQKPTTSIYGSETAAPLFFDIARDILLYYGIPPEQ